MGGALEVGIFPEAPTSTLLQLANFRRTNCRGANGCSPDRSFAAAPPPSFRNTSVSLGASSDGASNARI